MSQTPNKKRTIPLQKITIPPSPFLDRLGFGTGVNVWKFQPSPKSNIPKSPWAVKNVRAKLDETGKYTFQKLISKEADILSSMNHENIVQFRGLLTSEDGRQCLAMEKFGCSLGSLNESRLDEEAGPHSARNILTVVLSVAKALNYLHVEKNILHGDIKSGNILIQGDFEKVKLCDFGVCCKLVNGLAVGFVGTPIYSAPECQEDATGPVTAKSDMFSLGLVMWEMIALEPPHMDSLDDSVYSESEDDLDGTMDLVDQDLVCKLGTRPPLPSVVLGTEYNPVLEMFHCCTEASYEKRPTAKYLVDYVQLLQ